MSDIDVRIFISPKVVTPPPPSGRLFVRALHDFELDVYDHKPRPLFDPSDGLLDKQGYPETVPLLNRTGVKLTKEWQWFWFRQLILSVFGHSNFNWLTLPEQDRLKRAWNSLTDGDRALTNHAGTDTRENFIDPNGKDGLPLLFQLSMGGNVMELADPNPVSQGGVLRYKIKTLDGDRPPPDVSLVNRATHPELIQVATNSTPFKSGDAWVVDPFPQLATVGYPGHDVTYPLASRGGFDYVEVSRVVLMSEHEPFPSHPYNP